MPGRQGAGPMGAGAGAGRCSGLCAGAEKPAKGVGRGLTPGRGMACRRGFGRRFRRFSAGEEMTMDNSREILQARKRALENRLTEIDRRLEGL